jgi:hypothetical protein
MFQKPKSSNQAAAYAGGSIILAAIVYNVAVGPSITPSAILIEQYEFQVYCPIDKMHTSSNLFTVLVSMGFNSPLHAAKLSAVSG